MSGFLRFFGNDNSGNSGSDTPAVSDTVAVRINAGEEVRVPTSEVRGLTVAQLFSRLADRLGSDATRVVRYIKAGTVVPGDAMVEGGFLYQGSVSSEEKGLN